MNIIQQNLPGQLPASVVTRIDRLLSQPAIDTWKPTEGETLVGVIVGSRLQANPYGQQQRQILVLTPQGQRAAWLSPWLLSQLEARHATKGDVVAITYQGKRRSARGTEYHAYAVRVDNEEAVL